MYILGYVNLGSIAKGYVVGRGIKIPLLAGNRDRHHR